MPATEKTEQVHELFVRNISVIKGFVLGMCPDFAEADDIVQELFTLVTRKAEDFDPEGNFLGWVRAMARFKVLEHLRARKKLPCPLEEDTLEALAETAEEMDDVWERQRTVLAECMKKVAPKARRLLEARYLEGLLPAEIAKALSWTIGAVNVGLTRVRNSLRECAKRNLTLGEV